jgi:hypothetical protein
MDYKTFFRERQEARFGGKGGFRCAEPAPCIPRARADTTIRPAWDHGIGLQKSRTRSRNRGCMAAGAMLGSALSRHGHSRDANATQSERNPQCASTSLPWRPSRHPS